MDESQRAWMSHSVHGCDRACVTRSATGACCRIKSSPANGGIDSYDLDAVWRGQQEGAVGECQKGSIQSNRTKNRGSEGAEAAVTQEEE